MCAAVLAGLDARPGRWCGATVRRAGRRRRGRRRALGRPAPRPRRRRRPPRGGPDPPAPAGRARPPPSGGATSPVPRRRPPRADRRADPWDYRRDRHREGRGGSGSGSTCSPPAWYGRPVRLPGPPVTGRGRRRRRGRLTALLTSCGMAAMTTVLAPLERDTGDGPIVVDRSTYHETRHLLATGAVARRVHEVASDELRPPPLDLGAAAVVVDAVANAAERPRGRPGRLGRRARSARHVSPLEAARRPLLVVDASVCSMAAPTRAPTVACTPRARVGGRRRTDRRREPHQARPAGARSGGRRRHRGRWPTTPASSTASASTSAPTSPTSPACSCCPPISSCSTPACSASGATPSCSPIGWPGPSCPGRAPQSARPPRPRSLACPSAVVRAGHPGRRPVPGSICSTGGSGGPAHPRRPARPRRRLRVRHHPRLAPAPRWPSLPSSSASLRGRADRRRAGGGRGAGRRLGLIVRPGLPSGSDVLDARPPCVGGGGSSGSVGR